MAGPECRVCQDMRWVCEAHPDKPWGGAIPPCCNCPGPGMPCNACNPSGGIDDPPESGFDVEEINLNIPSPDETPASSEALAMGCTCDPGKNHHGRGVTGPDGRTMFYPDNDCPIHGIEAMAELVDPMNVDSDDEEPPRKH